MPKRGASELGDEVIKEIATEMARCAARRGRRGPVRPDDVDAAETQLKAYAAAATAAYEGTKKYAAARAPATRKQSLKAFRSAIGRGGKVTELAEQCVSTLGNLNKIGVAEVCLERANDLPTGVKGRLQRMKKWSRNVMSTCRLGPRVVQCAFGWGLQVQQDVFQGQVVAAYFGGLGEHAPQEAQTHTIGTHGKVRVWTNGNSRWLTGVPGHLAAHAANTAATKQEATVRHLYDSATGVCSLVAVRDIRRHEMITIPPTSKKEFEGPICRDELRSLLSGGATMVEPDKQAKVDYMVHKNSVDTRPSCLSPGCDGVFITRAMAQRVSEAWRQPGDREPLNCIWRMPVNHPALVAIWGAGAELLQTIKRRWPAVASYWLQEGGWLMFPVDCYGPSCPAAFKMNGANTRATRVGGGVRAELCFVGRGEGVTHVCIDVWHNDCEEAVRSPATHFELYANYAYTGTTKGRITSVDGGLDELDKIQRVATPVRLLAAKNGHISLHAGPNLIVYQLDDADVDPWRPVDWTLARVEVKLRHAAPRAFLVVGDDAAAAAYDNGGGRGGAGSTVYSLVDGELAAIGPGQWGDLVEQPGLTAHRLVPAAPFGALCWTTHMLPPQCFEAVYQSLRTSPATAGLFNWLRPWWPGVTEPGQGATTYVFVVAAGGGCAPRLAVRGAPGDPVLGPADGEVGGAPAVKGGAVLMRLWHP